MANLLSKFTLDGTEIEVKDTTARTAAANAQSTANTANSAASAAQTTANSANSAAAAAQSTANTANSTANSNSTKISNLEKLSRISVSYAPTTETMTITTGTHNV